MVKSHHKSTHERAKTHRSKREANLHQRGSKRK